MVFLSNYNIRNDKDLHIAKENLKFLRKDCNILVLGPRLVFQHTPSKTKFNEETK